MSTKFFVIAMAAALAVSGSAFGADPSSTGLNVEQGGMPPMVVNQTSSPQGGLSDHDKQVDNTLAGIQKEIETNLTAQNTRLDNIEQRLDQIQTAQKSAPTSPADSTLSALNDKIDKSIADQAADRQKEDQRWEAQNQQMNALQGQINTLAQHQASAGQALSSAPALTNQQQYLLYCQQNGLNPGVNQQSFAQPNYASGYQQASYNSYAPVQQSAYPAGYNPCVSNGAYASNGGYSSSYLNGNSIGSLINNLNVGGSGGFGGGRSGGGLCFQPISRPINCAPVCSAPVRCPAPVRCGGGGGGSGRRH